MDFIDFLHDLTEFIKPHLVKARYSYLHKTRGPKEPVVKNGVTSIMIAKYIARST